MTNEPPVDDYQIASSVRRHAAKGSIDSPVHSDTFKTMLTLHTYIVHLNIENRTTDDSMASAETRVP